MTTQLQLINIIIIISDFSETYYPHWDDKNKDARSVALTVELLQIQVFWDMMQFHWASKNDCELLYTSYTVKQSVLIIRL